ncbi:hypothetical protein [Sulfolobus monocaudavirus SMV3]|uniref:hypothetical protein n=1 Tax=Sulfolobus monocaudavirus SMV3 TaxID=1732177 RepID=UPI0007060471|nr:hypothetical protein AXI69_gp66 [Sulfolobus monocaudavirus SMV3]ALG97003.1 hypothetical protein [Sulfolobus monocaudavirus SMV3]
MGRSINISSSEVNKPFAQIIYDVKGEIIRTFGILRKKLLGVKDVIDLINIPAWIKSRLKDENGSVEVLEEGYGNRILIIKLEDPVTDDWTKKQRKTAFVIYFSFQTSKPVVPAQLPWKLNQIYKIVNKLRAKGYHVFPGIVAFSFTQGAKEILKKHKVEAFTTLDSVKQWIYNKIIFRLQKLVEIAKFTFKFDKIFVFLRSIIQELGYDIPDQLLEVWALKPKFPER